MTRLLIGTCAVLAALCAIQWTLLGRLKADLSHADARAYHASLVELDSRQEEVERVLTWLDAYVRTAPAGGRPDGLCRNGSLDVRTVGSLLFDAYLSARTEGATEADARRRVIKVLGAGMDGLQ